MARTLVLDTITDPDNSTGNANITLSPDSTTTLPKVDINSGTIDSTTLGAQDPSSVAATTLSASGNATVGGTFGVTGNTTVGGTFGVTGNTTVGGTLGVTGASTLTGNTTVGGALGVTGDVTVTGGDIKSSGGTTAISVSGANTTLAGTANNVGTITAGTWSGTEVAVAKGGTGATTASGARSNLELTAHPKLIKAVKVYGGSNQASTGGGGSNWTQTTRGYEFSVISGKTYLVETTALIYGGIDQLNLHADTTSRSQGATSVNNFPNIIMNGYTNGGQVSLRGVFTAGSTETRYMFLSFSGSNSTAQHQNSFINQYFLVYEFETASFWTSIPA
jgi:hypothetical protein